ncbi:MAG: hypothetical protein JXR67_03965, partial [Bacteroidales bacterium]|nr:hypothetical protein [Bacteroidales bacterium]
MKKVMFSFIIIASAIGMAAQAPLSFSYQAVIRDAGGSVMAEEPVTVRIILRHSTAGGFPVYTESHSTRTNTLGLVNLKIGEGSTADDFSSIDWSDGPYFLELSVNGIEMGTSQLLSVPYALYAGRSGDGFSGDYGDLSNAPDLSGYLTTETDPVFTGHSASGITSTAISNWNAAFGWGNHAGLYRLASYVPDWSDITGKPALAQVAVTGSYTDLNDIPAVFTPDVHTHPESDITDLRHYSDADIDGNEIA